MEDIDKVDFIQMQKIVGAEIGTRICVCREKIEAKIRIPSLMKKRFFREVSDQKRLNQTNSRAKKKLMKRVRCMRR